MLAEAAFLAARPTNRSNRTSSASSAGATRPRHGGDLETAALRVFGNADGAYGSNVNHLIENGRWEDEDELADTFTSRKGFAYGRDGKPGSRRSC